MKLIKKRYLMAHKDVREGFRFVSFLVFLTGDIREFKLSLFSMIVLLLGLNLVF